MSLQMGKILGIPIRLHFTRLIVFSLTTWTLAVRFMPQFFPGLSTAEYWLMGIVGAVMLFASVLLHELSHSIMAMKYGIRVKQIILFIFGGVSDIEKEMRHPVKEIRIALAGPVVSFALAANFAASFWLLTTFSHRTLVLEGIVFYGGLINAMLGVFNLIPAFPLDGGRILRAALIGRKRDFDRATSIAVRVGITISYGFMALGFVVIIAGGILAGIWLILIGWFMMSGADSYKSQHELTAALSNVRLADIMNPSFTAIPPRLTLSEAQKGYFAVHMKSAFPLVNVQGRLIGVITI